MRRPGPANPDGVTLITVAWTLGGVSGWVYGHHQWVWLIATSALALWATLVLRRRDRESHPPVFRPAPTPKHKSAPVRFVSRQLPRNGLGYPEPDDGTPEIR